MERQLFPINKRRSVAVIPTNNISLSSSCPDFDKKIKLNALARKRSVPDVDALSMLSYASNSSITSCPESSLYQDQAKSPDFKKRTPKKAFRYILPDRLRFKKKEKCPTCPVDPETDNPQSPLIDFKQRRPSELNLSQVVPKTAKSRKKSLPSLNLNIRPFNARRSTPGVDFPVRIVVSCTGEELTKRRAAADLESVDGPGKSKLSPYSKLLGKSMELLPTSSNMDSEVGPFRQETGIDCRDGEFCSIQPHYALLENPESETRWYFKYFLGKVHHNYLCHDNVKSPVFLSVVRSQSIYRCILWKKTGNKRMCIEPGPGGKWPSPKSILEKFSMSKYEKAVKEITAATIQKDLLTLEEQEGSVNFKFGVLYGKAGQKTDNDMFSNEHGSRRFQNFVELLGDEVGLQGWPQFRGGLDNKNNSTGKTSVYTAFEGHEIMFHVSTLLPYSIGNEQQLERKRHIGNDIVVIIFVDYDTNPEEAIQSAMHFNPGCMRSHFNHIFALVSYDDTTEKYRLNVCSAESVPSFGPPLPPVGEFNNHTAFRDFLLAKLINGEKAAYCTPTFAEKRERTLDLLLKSVEQKCTHEYRRTVSSPILHHVPPAPLQPNKKVFEREQSFADFGQRLKVEKIITGHHPTSQRTTVAPKRDPWHTQCIVKDFPYQITYGDVCEDGTLIVATQNEGTYFVFKDGSYSLIIDKSVPIGQITVAQRHQILLFRTSFTRENNYLYAIPLKEIYTEKIKIGVKSSLLPYHIPYTKGCHLFCTAPLDGQFLRLAVAVKTKVYMLAYKHPANLTINGSPITPIKSPKPLDNFIKHRELTLCDIPVHMSLLDERPSGKLCVSYLKQTAVDAIDEILGTVQRVPNLDIAKAKLTTMTGTYINGRSELLIGYNLTSQLIALNDGTSYNSVEIVWNAEPKSLVHMYPYILAFTANTVEIRMASNGSLMQTIQVPDLHLISMKGDLYFSSSSNRVHNPISKAQTPTANIPIKFPKNIDKKDFLTSGSFADRKGLVSVYKIMLESMTGKRESTSESIHTSVSDDSMSTYSTTIDERNTVSPPTLDYVHPILEHEKNPSNILNSFDEVVPVFNEKQSAPKDLTDLSDGEEPDYDHITPLSESPIVLKSLQGSPDESSSYLDFSPTAIDNDDDDYDHITPLDDITPLTMKPIPNTYRNDSDNYSATTNKSDVGAASDQGSSRAIRRRVITGRSPYRDEPPHESLAKTPSSSSSLMSPGYSVRGGLVYSLSAEVMNKQNTVSSSPDSGVQDDFPSANSFNHCPIDQQILSSSRTNTHSHS